MLGLPLDRDGEIRFRRPKAVVYVNVARQLEARGLRERLLELRRRKSPRQTASPNTLRATRLDLSAGGLLETMNRFALACALFALAANPLAAMADQTPAFRPR
jgi:hypothetical protein